MMGFQSFGEKSQYEISIIIADSFVEPLIYNNAGDFYTRSVNNIAPNEIMWKRFDVWWS